LGITCSFKVCDRAGDLLEEESYDSVTEQYLNNLKERQERGEIALFCCCSNEIEMKISKKKNHLYLHPTKRKPGHAADCVRHPQYEGSSDYEKAWRYDEDRGEYVVSVEDLISSSSKKESQEQTNKDSERKSKVFIEYSNNSKKKGKATIFGLATKLNMMAWRNIVLGKKKRLPEDAFELAKHVYGVSTHVRLSNTRVPISQMFYKSVKIKKARTQKDIFFVYMYYSSQRRGNVDKLSHGKSQGIVYGKDAFRVEHDFYVSIDEFNEKLSKEPHSNIYVIAGFAYKQHENHEKLTLGTYCLIPVSEKGLFVESFYERKVYDALCTANRCFYRPYLPIAEYEQFVPDLIIEEKGRKTIIGEVFGIEDNEEYERTREEKISLSEKVGFLELYDFWKWDANKGDDLILPT